MSEARGKSAPAVTVGSSTPSSLADLVVESAAPSFSQAFPAPTLIKAGVLALLVVVLNIRQFHWLAERYRDANWMHGYLIPLFSLYLLFARRAELFSAPRRTSLLGLVIMLGCLAGEFLGIYPIQNYMISQIFMVGSIFGLVLYLAGGAVMRVAWLPILFLLFAVPIPDTIYSRLAYPLQSLAARGAVGFLNIFPSFNITAVAGSSTMDFLSISKAPCKLQVAEACSGMKLLMAFLSLGVAMAYLDYKPVWQRVILVAVAIPIAIFCNVLRVIITAVMFYLDHPELGTKFMHSFTGMLMLIPAFGLLWLLAKLLGRIFVEEDEAQADSPGAESDA
jgi:exosortase